MHSDGYILDLIPDLLECGVNVINLQDLVNGVESIARLLKGRIAIDPDIGRQNVTRYGTPQQIDSLVRHAVETLGAREAA